MQLMVNIGILFNNVNCNTNWRVRLETLYLFYNILSRSALVSASSFLLFLLSGCSSCQGHQSSSSPREGWRKLENLCSFCEAKMPKLRLSWNWCKMMWKKLKVLEVLDLGNYSPPRSTWSQYWYPWCWCSYSKCQDTCSSSPIKLWYLRYHFSVTEDTL